MTSDDRQVEDLGVAVPFDASLWTCPLARAPPPMMATSDPTGRPIDEMKLRMKMAK